MCPIWKLTYKWLKCNRKGICQELSLCAIMFDIIKTDVFFIIITFNIFQEFRKFMNRLQFIDDTLEKLGTPKIYHKLYTCTKKMLIGWLVCSYSIVACDMIWWSHATQDWRCMIIPYVVNHYYNINMFMDLIFITFLWFVYWNQNIKNILKSIFN